jgi:hypothetical protein
MGVKFIDVDDAASVVLEKMRLGNSSRAIANGAAESQSARATVPFKLSKRKAPSKPDPRSTSATSEAPDKKVTTGWKSVAPLLIAAAIVGITLYLIIARTRSGDDRKPTGLQRNEAPAPIPPARSPAPVPSNSIGAAAPSLPLTKAPVPIPDASSFTVSEPKRAVTGTPALASAQSTPRYPRSIDAARPPGPAPDPEGSNNPY